MTLLRALLIWIILPMAAIANGALAGHRVSCFTGIILFGGLRR